MTFTPWSTPILMVAAVAWSAAVQAAPADVPPWLGGEPDLERREHWCEVYAWILDEADDQTEGLASDDDLASRRVINVANKLVTHHLKQPEDRYSAEIRYLIFDEGGPLHFQMQISRAELEQLMARPCAR